MTFAQAIVKDTAAGVTFADKPEDLVVIQKPDCAAVILRRHTDHGLQTWLDSLAPDQLPNGRVVLRPKDVPDAITQLCEVARTPHSVERTRLIEDVVDLVDLFADLMQARYLRVRLQAVKNNACRKFHVDAITARLICTYRGTGTQYGISRDGNDPAQVFTAPTGSPVVLRGTLWPPEPNSGLLHRSPPIEGTDETRLILVLDPVFDLGDAT
jgi:hypothetical protein